MKTILVDAFHTFVTTKGIFQEMKDMLDTFENRKIILTNATEEQKKIRHYQHTLQSVYSITQS